MNLTSASRSIALMLCLCAGLWPLGGQAAADTPAAPTPADTSHTSKVGDTLEKIAGQHYRGSPLHIQVLARQLLAHNADALPAGTATGKRLKPGLSLRLPSHEHMLRQALAPFLPSDAPANGPHCGPEAKRHWVHFP
jgi:hypothetical protein